MGDDDLSGLPWGSLSLQHVVRKGFVREEESKKGSRRDDEKSSYRGYEQQGVGGQAPLYAGSTTGGYYEEGVEEVYYDYGSGGSGHGGSSR